MKRTRPAAPPPAATSGPLSEDQEAWVERGMKVVAKCAKKHARKAARVGGANVTYEELLSLGSIGLMQAVRTYKRDKGTDFEVYCYKRVDGAMKYGIKKEGQFYALLWDATYTHLETTRDEGPCLDGDPHSDEDKLHDFSDRLLTAVARKVCGAATMMQSATSEEAVQRRAEWSQRMRVFAEELERTPEDGKEMLYLVYDEEMDLKAAGEKMGLKYGQTRRLHEKTMDDLGARVRRRCAFESAL